MATEPKKEQQPLPEEKLLKVIQGKGAAEKGAQAASESKAAQTLPFEAARPVVPAATADSSPKATPQPPVAAPAEKPKQTLKVAKADSDSSVPASVRPATKPVPAKPAPVPDAPRGRSTGSGISVSTVSRLLGLAAGGFLTVTCVDVVLAARALRSGKDTVLASQGAMPLTQNQAATNAVPEVASLDFIIFEPAPGREPPPPPPTNVDWVVYMKENVNMIGLSGGPATSSLEAILFDKKVQKMHVVKFGQKLTVEQRDITVESIIGEEVVLSDGKVKMTLR